jgi:hypothetical protein
MALAAGMLVGGVAAAPAAHASGCATANGVTVVVDFGSLGGVRVGCAAGAPGSGLAALAAAGFSYSFVPRQPGFVCQIAGLPDPCNGAPTSAYWAYWHGRPGGSWTYSNQGAGSYTPPPGSVEGWAFGAGQPPGIAPPALPAPAPRPTTAHPTSAPPPPSPPPPPPPPPSGGGGGGGGGPPRSGPATQPGGTVAVPGRGAGPTAPAGSETASGTAGPGALGGGSGSAPGTATGSSPGGPATGEPPAVGDTAADRGSAGGVSAGLVVGVVLIGVITGLAVLARRRQARGSP